MVGFKQAVSAGAAYRGYGDFLDEVKAQLGAKELKDALSSLGVHGIDSWLAAAVDRELCARSSGFSGMISSSFATIIMQDMAMRWQDMSQLALLYGYWSDRSVFGIKKGEIYNMISLNDLPKDKRCVPILLLDDALRNGWIPLEMVAAMQSRSSEAHVGNHTL